ncbi:MAG: YbhB/YbcL family Raf kinase inhibitor-like protein [Candidatus Acidiferrales bacterium]
MIRKYMIVVFALLAVSIGAGVRTALAQHSLASPSKFQLTSPAFSDGGAMPAAFSCADPGAGSPPLQWSNAPEGTASFAVIMHDVDTAPAKGSMDVTHWILWNIPASTSSIAAGVKPDSSPDGMRQGKNIHGDIAYRPACPPPGAVPHHYVFEIFALNANLDLPAGSTRSELLAAMDGHVIGKSAYVGKFSR